MWQWREDDHSVLSSLHYHHHHHHHHHLALQPYVSLGLLCYSPPLLSILSFPSPSAIYYLG
jgi:hypothetical protein